MNNNKADEVQFALIQFFEQEFDKGRAEITMTGAIKFDTEQTFGLWYQLSERLRKGNSNKFDDLISFLRRYYAGKTPDEIKHNHIPTRIPTKYEQMMADMGIEIDND